MAGVSDQPTPAPMGLVVLVDGEVRPEPDLMRWAEQVAADPVGRVDETQVGDVWVSTVFRWIADPCGDAFETMTFGLGSWDHRCWRYATLESAKVGHAAVVAVLSAGCGPDDVASGVET
jgi:hypothetical protein